MPPIALQTSPSQPSCTACSKTRSSSSTDVTSAKVAIRNRAFDLTTRVRAFAALLIWLFGEILAVDVDGIEDEQRGGDLLHRFLDAVFAAAGHEVLERTQVPGFGIDRDHLTLDDGVGGLQVAAGQIRDVWILGRDPFQPAGENLNVISFLMNLQAFAVILVLGDTPAAEFGENLPGVP